MTALLALSGCGFHMKGESSVPSEMERTYISAIDEFSLFYRQLKLQLRANGVQIVELPTESTAILSIHFDQTDQRVLSVSARNTPTEYEVYYSIEYSLDSGEKNIQPKQFITLTRDYTYDETLVLGKSHEEQVLREAIVDDLVRTVLRQLGNL
jgi:LPS-assembly lipoprotein